jgi:hypothetical protein
MCNVVNPSITKLGLLLGLPHYITINQQVFRALPWGGQDLPYDKLLGLSVLGASVTLQRLEIQVRKHAGARGTYG